MPWHPSYALGTGVWLLPTSRLRRPAASTSAPPTRRLRRSAAQDLRSPDAADTGRPLSPQPVKSSPAQGQRTPWSAIGLGLAGVCLALAGAAVTAGRIRRRTGVAA